MIWGAGLTLPGGKDAVLDLVTPLGIDPSSSVIEIGAGMGGGTRAIASKFGAYVTGLDLDPDLAAEGTKQAENAKVHQKASVDHLDMAGLDLRANFYSGALIRETLYQMEPKKQLLCAALESLKPRSQIVLSDLFLDDAATSPAIDEWKSGETRHVQAWSLDSAKRLFADLGVDIRVVEDRTEAYVSAAQRGWQAFVDGLVGNPLADELVIPMVREVEFWARRLSAMDTGELKLFRVVGLKGDTDR